MIQPDFLPTPVGEFLAILAGSETKLELIDGEILAFAGGTTAHGILCTRIVNLLSAAADRRCQVFTSDMALQLTGAPTHVFPDATYTGEDLDPNREMIFAPRLVVEVISRTSENRDRVKKLDAYQRIPSVREYLMIDSRFVWGCLYRRFEEIWTQITYGVDDTIALYSLPLEIAMSELYAGIGKIGAP